MVVGRPSECRTNWTVDRCREVQLAQPQEFTGCEWRIQSDKAARMWQALIAAMLVAGATGATAPAAQGPGFTYHSTKSLVVLQKCLTDNLAAVGEVVAVKSDENTTTLVLRDIPEGPMTIDLAPPSVTVTSKPAPHTRHLIKACL